MLNTTSQDGSLIFMPIFIHCRNSLYLVFTCFYLDKSHQYFKTLGGWHLEIFLYPLFPPSPLLYATLIYILSSEMGIKLSQFSTESHFLPLGLHGYDFPEPRRQMGIHRPSPCWETLTVYSQISETQKKKSTHNGWVWGEVKDTKDSILQAQRGQSWQVKLYGYV